MIRNRNYRRSIIWSDEVCIICKKEFKKPSWFFYNICESCDVIPLQKGKHKLQILKNTELWKESIKHFENKCAYCGVNEIEQVEHFIPIRLGGKTDPFNCVPTCRKCNNNKYVMGDKLPGYEIVKEYLENLKNKYPNLVDKNRKAGRKIKEIKPNKNEIKSAIKIMIQAKSYAKKHDDELAAWIRNEMAVKK